jgi:hypothetical protein
LYANIDAAQNLTRLSLKKSAVVYPLRVSFDDFRLATWELFGRIRCVGIASNTFLCGQKAARVVLV